MNRLLTTLLLLFFSIVAVAQIEKQDTVPLIIRNQLNPNRLAIPEYQNASILDKRTALDKVIGKAIGATSVEQTTLKLPPIHFYQGPPVSIKETKYPFSNNYSYGTTYRIEDNLYIGTSSQRLVMPTLMRINSISSNLYYQPHERLGVWGGVVASKYETLGKFYNNSIGIQGGMKYKVSDRISINGYGQYSTSPKSNMGGSPIMNVGGQRYYGGTIEVKITDKFGLQGGMERQLDPMSGKWKNVPVISPVFYAK